MSWNDPDCPKIGWSLKGGYSHPKSECEGLRGPNPCAMECGQQPIHIEVLSHPDWPVEMHVGCDCSGHMQGDLEAARDRFRRRAEQYAADERAARLEQLRQEHAATEQKARREALAAAQTFKQTRLENWNGKVVYNDTEVYYVLNHYSDYYWIDEVKSPLDLTNGTYKRLIKPSRDPHYVAKVFDEALLRAHIDGIDITKAIQTTIRK